MLRNCVESPRIVLVVSSTTTNDAPAWMAFFSRPASASAAVKIVAPTSQGNDTPRPNGNNSSITTTPKKGMLDSSRLSVG